MFEQGCHIMKKIIVLSALIFAATTHANDNHPFYLAADAGVFQGSFNNTYLDQTDTIAQNFEQNVLQNGYTGGLALGYQHALSDRYSLGAEISGQGDSSSATFQEGASSAAFSDTTQFNAHMDLSFVPSMRLTKSINAFFKAGLSVAWMKDSLNSPVGNSAVMTNYTSNNTRLGGILGLGFSKKICKRFKLFTEADYHDYGTVNFPAFQNFTATYTHSSHIYSYDVLGGAAYSF